VSAEARKAIREALLLLPVEMSTPEAVVIMLAIGLQESRLIHRRQLVGNPPKPIGPAKGLWQFERLGGCKGVVAHPASRYWMSRVCNARGIVFNATAIWNAIESDDTLAAAAARLLMFTDRPKLPPIGDEKAAWNMYLRTWRPGKPHRATWPGLYTQAVELL
jgi:hypothetical protein